jgi:hypothetical protein
VHGFAAVMLSIRFTTSNPVKMAIFHPKIYISENLTLNVATGDTTLFSAIIAGLRESDLR